MCRASIFLSNLSCAAGSTVVMVVKGNPTDEIIVRKSLGLTRVFEAGNVGMDYRHLFTDLSSFQMELTDQLVGLVVEV